MDTIQQRVKRGAEWLDANVPGWWTAVELGLLDLSAGCQCVIGQIDGDSYGHGMEELGRNPLHDKWAIAHGFDSRTRRHVYGSDFAALTKAWAKAIALRQRQWGM